MQTVIKLTVIFSSSSSSLMVVSHHECKRGQTRVLNDTAYQTSDDDASLLLLIMDGCG